MMISKLKKLDLGVGFLGGYPVVFARNILQDGDYAKVAFLTGKSNINLKENDKILIEMLSEFDQQNYLEQVKAFILARNSTITFANDCPTGSFIDAEKLLAETLVKYPKLMSFEKTAILNEKRMLHKIYLAALVQDEDRYGMPNEFNYEINSGHLYPIIPVYKTIKNMI